MRQEQFVARYQQEWSALEQWLQQRAGASRRRRRQPPPLLADGEVLDDALVPQRYRRLCQQLALARDRGYSPQLVARLQQLVQRGHAVLYRMPPTRFRRALEFLLAGFPRLVRSQARSMWVATALFTVPTVATFVLVQYFPDLIHLLMDNVEIASMERMYDPAAERLGRDSGTDWMMFGYYIMNNVSIALRTFASGLLAGIGTLLALLFNGVVIGGVAGHLQHIGHGDPFWRFVCGHGAFELTAIVLAGGAGLQLGMRVLAPGRKGRMEALVEGGWIGARLCMGIAVMLLIAAFIEAFWSSIASIPAWGKYSVAGVLWTVVLLWLALGGRGGVAMQIDHLNVVLRARSSFEAMELGTALVRRQARAAWGSWLLASAPFFIVFNALGWWLDAFFWAWLLLWWCRPLFDRLPLYVISRGVFGESVGVRQALAAQRHWGWTGFWGYLGWRRFSAMRDLCLPVNLLEGAAPAQRAQRRRAVAVGAAGPAMLLAATCVAFEAVVIGGVVAGVFILMPLELMSDAWRSTWALVSQDTPAWADLGLNLLAWLAGALVSPFQVGAGFGLYLNRRTQMEAWDVEIALRRLRERLAKAATSLALVLALALPMAATHAQQAPLPSAGHEASEEDESASRGNWDDEDEENLIHEDTEAGNRPVDIFGERAVDTAGFRQAVRRAYEDPLQSPTHTVTRWQQIDPDKPKEKKEKDPSSNPLAQAVRGAMGAVAAVAEYGLWIIVGVVVLVLLATCRLWWPWLRIGKRRKAAPPPAVAEDSLDLPEVLPPDVATQARALWDAGRPRQALALLYRACVQTVVDRTGALLPPGATEAQCMRAARRMPEEVDRTLFARMVRMWQYAAYGGRLPGREEFDGLATALQERYRWQG